MKTACTREDRSCRFPVDCSSNRSLTWEPGKTEIVGNLTSSKFYYSRYKTLWNEKLIFIYLFYSFGREKHKMGRNHGKGYLELFSHYN